MSQSEQPQSEHLSTEGHQSLLCWKSSFAGLLIALMGFIMLTALGAGVAGFTAEGLINREEGGSGLATTAGLFMGFAALVSLFCGSYFALRVSRFVTTKIGAAHGFVIASLFFMLMLFGTGSAIGGVVQGFGKLAKGAGDQASNLAGNPIVQDTVNKAIGSAPLKSSPQDVAQGLTMRLVQGNTDSAKSYLVYQTGQSPAEVDAKVTQLKNDFDAAAKRAGEMTAHAIGDASLTLFVMFLVGLVAAVMGGRIGAQANATRPFGVYRSGTGIVGLSNQRGNMLPYLLGWLMGVPVTILFLIALLRTVF